MAKIIIEGMHFYSFHGHYKEETILGGQFLVDLELETEIGNAAKTDKLKDVINYKEVYDLIKKRMENPSKLVETLTVLIIKDIKNKYGKKINSVKIKISKLNPPVGGKVDKFSVEIKE